MKKEEIELDITLDGYVPTRVISPSQIATMKQCFRKWYYQKIEELASKTTFALQRGTIIHNVIQKLMTQYPKKFGDDFLAGIRRVAIEILDSEWINSDIDLLLPDNKIENKAYNSTIDMLNSWLTRLEWNLNTSIGWDGYANSYSHAWNILRPKFSEHEMRDTELCVRGYADEIHEKDGKTFIKDYKTGKIYKIGYSEDYNDQLLIYALLYYRNYDEIPEFVCIDWLRYGYLTVRPIHPQDLLDTVDLIISTHKMMESEKIEDYPTCTNEHFCPYCSFVNVCEDGGQYEFNVETKRSKGLEVSEEENKKEEGRLKDEEENRRKVDVLDTLF